MLPKMLQDHISMFLNDYIVSNWDVKCGKINTLTIHWKKYSGDSSMPNMQSTYRKKPPSQVRRDQRRSKMWKENGVITNSAPDSGISGLSITPKDNDILHIDNYNILPAQ